MPTPPLVGVSNGAADPLAIGDGTWPVGHNGLVASAYATSSALGGFPDSSQIGGGAGISLAAVAGPHVNAPSTPGSCGGAADAEPDPIPRFAKATSRPTEVHASPGNACRRISC